MSSMPASPASVPTPTQRRVATELFDRRGPRPSFDPMIGPELRAQLEEGIGPLVADRQPDEPLYLAKRTLGLIHACEGWLVADRNTPFVWSVAAARGTVAHK